MKTIVETSVYYRILEFYSGVIIAYPNTFDSNDAIRNAYDVYLELMDMCTGFSLPRIPRIKAWRDAGYLELFSIRRGWCFGYTIDLIDGEPVRHIRVCEKSENIR